LEKSNARLLAMHTQLKAVNPKRKVVNELKTFTFASIKTDYNLLLPQGRR